jgi:hypothetical protein
MTTKRELELHSETITQRAETLEADKLKAETLLQEAGAIIERQRDEAEYLVEGMRDLQFALENRGWKLLYGGVDQREFDGLSLDVVKSLSDELRAFLTGGSLAKRLIEVRSNFVIGAGGIQYTKTHGVGNALDDFNNLAKLFGTEGLQELVRAEGTDGTVVFLVNSKTKKVRRLPLNRIDALYINPDDPEDIQFVKSRYNRVTVEKPAGEEVQVWYRTDLNDSAAAKRKATINEGSQSVRIDKEWVAVVHQVNGQIGHTLGTPDLLASLPWLERYNEYLVAQLDFQKALSAIAVHIKAKTTKAQDQARSAIRTGGRAGVATTGEDTSIEAQRGGSDVSFENGRALAAMASTGAEVSVVHALSDPGASGSSYGSAQTLDSPTQKMIIARREVISMLLKRVFAVLGASKAEVNWPRIEDEATYRLIQAVATMWQTGLFKPEELRGKFADLVDLGIEGTGPSDVLTPNTKATLEAQGVQDVTQAQQAAKLQADAQAKAAAANAATFAVNGQGQDNLGIGKTNDQKGARPTRPAGQ